jgi:hypothetical protein
MADFAYMASTKNLKAILEKIRGAGTPPKFTHDFLRTNLGFTSSTDRSVVGVLKGLGFLSADAVPTPRYNEFRDANRSGTVLAQGLREGWADLFLSDQRAYERSTTELKELFKNASGKGESAAEKMATTFKILADAASWATGDSEAEAPAEEELSSLGDSSTRHPVQLHHDVHVHLPPTSDVSVYTAIFRALRQELLE